MTPDRYAAAPTWEAFLEGAEANRDLWHDLYARTVLPAWAREAVATLDTPVHLLALSADWCGDAVNILPWIARLAEASDWIEFRVVDRDENPDLMDAHLTNGARSIPIVVVYDEAFRETGAWGPRPAPLQHWFETEGRALEYAERYPRIRRWYARDRGVTILSELLQRLGVEASVPERAAILSV
jgi:hypothetical protein